MLAARRANVPVRKAAELAGISPDTVQRWTQGAARGESGLSRARTPQTLPGVVLDDADTAFVLDSALREYAAAQMEHQVGDSAQDGRGRAEVRPGRGRRRRNARRRRCRAPPAGRDRHDQGVTLTHWDLTGRYPTPRYRSATDPPARGPSPAI